MLGDVRGYINLMYVLVTAPMDRQYRASRASFGVWVRRHRSVNEFVVLQ